MKRMAVAIGLFIFIIVTIFSGNLIVKKQCESIRKEIESVKIYISNSENLTASEKIEDIKQLWHKKKAIISIFSNHEPLDEITVCINELECASEIKDNDKAMLVSAEIIAYIDRITEEQRIHTESFF